MHPACPKDIGESINSNLQLGTQKTETVEKQDRSTASVN